MKPGKNILRTVLIWLVAVVAYNVIVWLLPVEHTSTFMVPYIFTMITFFLPLGVAVLTFGRPTPMKSKFLGYPLFHIAMVSLVLQLIVGLIFMLLAETIGMTLPLIVHVILLAIGLIGMISGDIGRDEIQRVEQNVKPKVVYIQTLLLTAENMTGKAADPYLKKRLGELTDLIRYSDPMSAPELQPMEAHISEKMAQLGSAVYAADTAQADALIGELTDLLNQRSRACKLYK